MLRKLLNYENPLMQFLGKVADLVWLNILTLIFCLPVFTAGASITAMYALALKLKRGEEGYILKDFWRSFKQNFKQATLIWLMWLAAVLIIAADIALIYYAYIPVGNIFRGVLIAAAAVFALATVFVFPLLSRFSNSIKNTFKNSLLLAVSKPYICVLMLLSWLPIPFLLYHYIQALPAFFFFFFSLPGYICALLYDNTFRTLEESSVKDNSLEDVL